MTDLFETTGLRSFIIGGCESSGGGTDSSIPIESLNPYTGDILWRGENATPEIIDNAVADARAAFQNWARKPFEDRRKIIDEFVSIIRSEAEKLSQLIATEGGKPLWEAKAEVNSLVAKFDASVEAYRQRAAEVSKEVRGMRSRTRFLPHGVMAVLGPFNFPMSMANSHIMPALLAGNTVVFKPSNLTPLCGLIMSLLWQKAGLPPGVLNCVSGGRAAGEYLVNHESINGVLLVGSHSAGLSILNSLSDSPDKIVAVEMGGNSPLVIWDYDDLDTAVYIIIQSTYLSAGQRCTAARRLLVKNTDDALIQRLREVLDGLHIGDPTATPQPFYGPVIRPSAAKAVITRVQELISGGARTISNPIQQGPFETVISPGLLDMQNCTTDRDEEIFGPILKVYRYKDFDDAVRLANDTKFGLAAGIVCRERGLYEEFFNRITAGIINWNQQLTGATTFAPFGGIKHSGNFRPAGFLSVDYCSYPTASFEVEKPQKPTNPSPGIQL